MATGDLERGNGKNRGNSYNRSSSSYSLENDEKQWTSWLVPMFLVANVDVFVVVMYINNCPNNNPRLEGRCVARFLGRLSFQPTRENPLFGPSSNTGICFLLIAKGCIGKIGSTGVVQVCVGLIYLLFGLGGSILSALFIQRNISVGASGALFGLLGAMLSELLTNWTIYTNKAAALITLVVIIAINLAIGILPHVDNFAHIGGFLSGFLLGFVLLLRPQFGWVGLKNLPAGAPVKSKHMASGFQIAVVFSVISDLP
ncbi:Replication factor C 2 isoform 1 [Hibiscus syriacus]|uniref:RHOMBOID-like protein n=1 Tax=Hibiscus syriacus TaxID=106335 RepID=A0A6A3AX20_HIBSY|nr:Replication factor C 2 isoform 1 [Hibiscus syriacus]